jgi:hypothetical protein
MALLWVEFVKALRERWFQQQLLPFMVRENSELKSWLGGTNACTSIWYIVEYKHEGRGR